MSGPTALARLQDVCIPGQGELHAIVEHPVLQAATSAVSSVATNAVLLTPRADSPVYNPVTHKVQPGDVYRSVTDLRSFSVSVGDEDIGSFTVKGGDLPAARRYTEAQLREMATRIRDKEIPGAGVLEHSLHEFQMAVDLQTRALELLGRLTFTALPYCVKQIKSVQNRHGEMVSVRDYMNSDEYLDPASVGAKGTLGNLLVGKNRLRPSQYWYATKGLNLRVNCLVSARYFTETDIDTEPKIDYRLPSPTYGRAVHGDMLPRTPTRKDDVFRTVYHALGEAYGFDAAIVLPRGPVTDKTYLRQRQKIPEICRDQGIPEQVIPTFISRTTEVAALAHSQEATLSALPNIGGSLVSRNVTLDGYVLDLDTYGQTGSELRRHVQDDIEQLVATVALLNVMISPVRDIKPLVSAVEESYRNQLERVGTDSKLRRRLLGAVGDTRFRSYLGTRGW